MKAKKLPSGRWRCQVYLGESADGKKIRKSVTADSKKEAERKAAELLLNNDTLEDCRFDDALRRYIENRSTVLSPSTIRGYRGLQRNAYSDLNRRMVSQIKGETMQAFVNKYAVDHSPKSTKNAYNLALATIRTVRPNVQYNVYLPQKKKVEYHVPTDSDVNHMLDSCDGYLRRSILLASIGTLRRGEICALRYEDINGDMIHIHRAAVEDENYNTVYREIPKTTASDRYITFPHAIIEELGEGDGLIVPLTPTQLSHRWGRLKKRLKLSCRFHDLRHYSASIMHALGIPDQYIMERGGWGSDGVLKAVYRNTLDDMEKEFSDKANNYFEKKFTQSSHEN